jgi:hypothetical protein
MLTKNKMENAIIQINNGDIRLINKREPNVLTLSKLQELLHSYYTHKGGNKDETPDIMSFIRANRGYTTHSILKQSSNKTKTSSLKTSL